MRSKRISAVLVVTVALVLGVAAPAFAGGRKAGSTKGSLSLVVLSEADVAEHVDDVPHHGDDVTFEVSTTATDQPYVNVRCYQGSAFVYDGWAGFFDGAWFGQTFTLEGPYWPDGAADCDARLVMFGSNGRVRTLASLSFPVAA